MTDYINIPDGQIDQDSPVTDSLLKALRDNLLAIAEGAPGAPRIASKAIGGFQPGEVLTFSNDTPKAMTATDPAIAVVKSIRVMHDGTYRVKYLHGVNSGYGAVHQVYAGDIPQGSLQNSAGAFTIDVTVLAGQNIEVRGNGGGNPGASGAVISNMRLYVSDPVDFGIVA